MMLQYGWNVEQTAILRYRLSGEAGQTRHRQGNPGGRSSLREQSVRTK
jgi:hypothetical protein